MPEIAAAVVAPTPRPADSVCITFVLCSQSHASFLKKMRAHIQLFSKKNTPFDRVVLFEFCLSLFGGESHFFASSCQTRCCDSTTYLGVFIQNGFLPLPIISMQSQNLSHYREKTRTVVDGKKQKLVQL
jgi:hypothetical protein